MRKIPNQFRPVALVLLLGLSAQLAFANGTFQAVSGDVRAMTTGAAVQVPPNARIAEGTTVTTGPGSRATIRLDDGHAVVLPENSEFKLEAFQFNRATPASNNIAIRLLKGALRSVSGLVGGTNPGGFALRTATATVGIRGTDFNVGLDEESAPQPSTKVSSTGDGAGGDVEYSDGGAIGDPLTIISVNTGQVNLGNTLGQQTLGPGQLGSAGLNSAPEIISGTQLSTGLTNLFSQANSVVISTGVGGVGATTTATGGGLSTGALVGIGAGLGAAAAGLGGNNDNKAPGGTTGTR